MPATRDAGISEKRRAVPITTPTPSATSSTARRSAVSTSAGCSQFVSRNAARATPADSSARSTASTTASSEPRPRLEIDDDATEGSVERDPLHAVHALELAFDRAGERRELVAPKLAHLDVGTLLTEKRAALPRAEELVDRAHGASEAPKEPARRLCVFAHRLPAKRSVALTSSCTMPGSNAECPASATMRSSASGHAACRSHALVTGQITS